MKVYEYHESKCLKKLLGIDGLISVEKFPAPMAGNI